MKKFLALLLALIMVMSLAACVGPEPDPTTEPTNAPTQGSTPTTAPTAPTEPSTEPTEPAVGTGVYTYNGAMSVFPTTWNPHTYQTATDGDVLAYVSDGFYGFDFNETKDGYVLVPSMVVDDHPVDITDQYVGQYGIEEGDSEQVWLINLRDDLYWHNGDKITANDFVESAKRLLNPDANNYRADTLYAGSLVIHNAESYMKQGRYIYTDDASQSLETLVKGDDGYYYTADGAPAFAAVDFTLAYLGRTLSYYVDGYGDAYFDTSRWEELKGLANIDGCVQLNDEVYEMLKTTITGNPAWGEDESYMPNYIVYAAETYPEMAYEEVGIFALSDTELVYVIDSPMSGFYLKYQLPSGYLVHIETYDACETFEDGVYTNTYGTSVETTMSYGAYKMDTFQKDKEITFSKNELFFDLTDDTYQTTNVNIQFVPEATTRLELFLAGELDSYGLAAEDMDTYSLSDYTYYSVGDSTFAMTFNPDLGALTAAQANAGENINKTILTLPEFRMAMSLAMDRANFCLATSPLNSPAFGLFSSNIISDPEAGVAYRTTDVAKEALASFWGVSEDYGEGKLYADIDEAIASITGYNLALAKEYFDKAYDKAIAEGLMDEDDVVEICVGIPSPSASFYANGYEFIVNNYKEAVVGTKLEGKLTFTRDDTVGNNFATALQNNQVNMLFGVGWTGSQLDPYGLMQVYVDPNYQYDSAFDLSVVDLTININGEDLTTSVKDWYDIMNGQAMEVTKADGTTMEYSCGTADEDPAARLQILGAMEQAILMNYNFIPLMDDAGANLKGMQIEYFVEEYVPLVGFGGIKYYTYNYDDAEWAAYVDSQNGELDYT